MTLEPLSPRRRAPWISCGGRGRGRGRAVHRAVARRSFADVGLELGGAYVANVRRAAQRIIDCATHNAGRSCCGVERVSVARSEYGEFVSAAAAALESLRPGDPHARERTLGPTAPPDAPAAVQVHIDGVREDVAVHRPTARPRDAALLRPLYAPTFVSGCHRSMDLMRDESFGLARRRGRRRRRQCAPCRRLPLRLRCGRRTPAAPSASRRGWTSGLPFRTDATCSMRIYLGAGGCKDSVKGVSLSRHGIRGGTRLVATHFTHAAA
ncbi:Aldehyde/histidinol dehydrogenase [Pelagophyceae sp. CCMP2097]|nr:Aldehyde/histidinol dehydrogenase [Pelagophyceae sp. CCMP2097]